MRVKALAELADTTVRTIRYYHSIGLLPTPKGEGFRDYGFDHLVRLFRIRYLVDAGMSLNQIREIVSDQEVDVINELAATEEVISGQIRELELKRRRLATMRKFYATSKSTPLERLVPLPQKVDDYYDTMLNRASSSKVREIIQRERQAVELLLTWELLPELGANWPDDLDETRIRNAMTLYESFAQFDELDVDSAEHMIDHILDDHLKLIIGDPVLDADWIPSAMQTFAQSDQAKSILAAAFPHPLEQLYIERALYRFNHVLESTAHVSRETKDDVP